MPIPTITRGWPWPQPETILDDDNAAVCNPYYGVATAMARIDHVHALPETSNVREPITCGGCGANVKPSAERCEHCGAWFS